MSRRTGPKAGLRGARSYAELKAEIDRLRRELTKAEEKIQQLERGGAEPLVSKRLAELEEGQKVARGLAVDAAVARSRAEAELRSLRDAIEKAPGITGWLLRKAQRRLGR
jgi:hypothetical protein